MRFFSRLKQAATLILCLCLAVSLARPLHAQTTNASLAGVVTDASGAAVGNVTIVIKNLGTAQTRTVTSDNAGRYDVQNLIPGSYEISAEAPGFSRKLLTGIILAVSQQASVNIPLSVGQATDTVSVQADEALTQTESSENGTVIENKKVVELPLANRQFYSLALLSPGAYPPAQTSTLGFRGGFSVAGASEETNLFTYNGVYDSSIGTQQPSYRPSIETIQEFKLLTGVYGAEYGKYSGAQIVVLEKQGSNTLHGSVYEFIRNQYTDAKPYFTSPTSPNPAFRQNTFGFTFGGPIRKDKTFFFGGYEGQRVNQQNTSLSTIPDASMLNGIFPGTTPLFNPYTGAALVKTTAANATPSSPAGTYDLKQMAEYTAPAAQLGQSLASYYPTGSNAVPGAASGILPTDPTVYPNSNYVFSSVQVEKMNEWTVRVDHTLSAKDSLNVSYQEFRDPTLEPANTLCGNASIPNGGCQFNQIVHLITLQEAHIFKPTLLNTLTFGYNRFQMPRTPTDSSLVNPPILPGAFNNPTPVNTGLPSITVSGYSTLGGPTNIPQNQWLNQYELFDAVNLTHGAHSFKFGLDTFLAITTETSISSGRGAAAFNTASLPAGHKTGNSAADLLLGVPYTTTRSPTAPNVHEGNYSYYIYAMDDWKITKFLTLNLGLRYEFNAPSYDSKGVISRYSTRSHLIEMGDGVTLPTDPSILALVDVNAPRFHYLYDYDWNDFAPRLGFSWQPFHSDKTVLKGAYGIFYNGPIEYNQYIGFSTQLPERTPQTFTTTASTPLTLASPFPTGGTPGLYTASAAEFNQPTPYIQEWSLGTQQALTSSLVMELVYLGSHGTHLANSRNINAVPIAAAQAYQAAHPTNTSAQQSLRPDTKFGNISDVQSTNSSSYNSLQAKLQQTYKHGISYLIAYTYGKSIDQGGGSGSSSNSSGSLQDTYNARGDRGLSDFNIKHRIAISPVLELPFGKGKPYFNHGLTSAAFGGFQVSGIFQFQTGRPFTVYNSASNQSQTFEAADRPNIVPGQDPNAGPKTVKQWFNVNAFQLQPAATFGNEPRNAIIGPGLVQVDATIAREFPIYERFHGQLRVEAFNLFNHPNFFNPYGASGITGSTFQGAQFGQITNAYNPRELQAALRLTF